MTTPTTNAVPSNSPLDLLYNAEQLDRVVTDSALEYQDRLGVLRKTAAGALAAFASGTTRGAWTAATVYAPRDVVSNLSGGFTTWYMAVNAHTSGVTFAGDLAAHWRVHQGVTREDLANAGLTFGPSLIAIDLATAYNGGSDDWLGGLLYTSLGRTAREIAAGVTPTNYAYAVGDIRRYGAVEGGSVDCTAAITAADTVACSQSVIIYGNTIQAEGFVYFPPGKWKATNLAYRGAPWRGAGINVSVIYFYASSGACIDAVGTTSTRKQLALSGLTLDGSNCTGTSAYALKLGYNQRSHEAARGLRIQSFPGTGLYFSGPCWMMDWYSVYIYGCGRDTESLRTGIYIDPALGALQLLAFNWYGLWLEDNGFAGSAVGGGMDISTNAVDSWSFYGATWEGNYGLAEVRFKNCINICLVGTIYVESIASRVVNGVLWDGVFGKIDILRVTGESSGMSGDGLKVIGASTLTVDKLYSNIKWVNDISTANTSRVMMGESAALLFSVGAGSRLIRRDPEMVTLTDAATIAVNAAAGTVFTVTLFDNRTMGAPTNPSIGQEIDFIIIQNGTTAACTLAWNAVFKMTTWSNTGNTASKRSMIGFRYDGASWNQKSPQVPYL